MSKLKHKIIIGVLLACALAVGTVPAGSAQTRTLLLKFGTVQVLRVRLLQMKTAP